MKKILLVGKKDHYPCVKGIEVVEIYNQTSIIQRIIRYWHIKTGIFRNFMFYWYGDWKHDISKYDVIVILDSILDNDIIPFIRKHNENAILNLCYRNRVKPAMGHSVFIREPQYWKEKYNCISWSYSKEDSDNYGMSYYHQFFLAKGLTYNPQNIYYDVFFVGKDKRRLNQLLSIKELLQQNGLNCLFIITPDRRRYKREEKRELSKPISYNDVIDYDNHSRCILDIVTEENYGLTYRVLEAIFLNKKLITNYHDIIQYEFYNPNNVFVIGKDNWDDIGNFINSKCEIISENMKNKYSYESFINLIFRNS